MRCSKKMAIQVCTKLWLHNYAIERNCLELFVACYPCLIMNVLCPQANLQYWSMFIFRRLKINHDSHEFILEFGTVANTYILLKALAFPPAKRHWALELDFQCSEAKYGQKRSKIKILKFPSHWFLVPNFLLGRAYILKNQLFHFVSLKKNILPKNLSEKYGV